MSSIHPFSLTMGAKTLTLPEVLHLKSGDVIWVTGPSGIGKTTFLKEAARQLRFIRACVLFQDHPLTGPLTPAVNASLGVLRDIPWWKTLLGVPGSIQGEALPLLRQLGLEDPERPESASLSGGERQRCLLARAILARPQVLIADEPTSQLDHDTGKACLELLVKSLKDASILISNHDPESMSAIPHRRLDLQTQDTNVLVKELP